MKKRVPNTFSISKIMMCVCDLHYFLLLEFLALDNLNDHKLNGVKLLSLPN